MDILVNTAIVGTGQVPTPSLASGLPTDALTEQLITEDPEHQLLLTAGILSVYQHAGYTPHFFPEQPTIAEPEEQRLCPESVAPYLQQLLRETPGALLLEALQLMRQANLLLPARLLPGALNIERTFQEYRALVYPLLGKRGLWLSQFQAAWSWVGRYAQQQEAILPTDSERIWHEGTPEERREILLRQRGTDPAVARTWLTSAWHQEPAETRKALLLTLAQHLSPDDEPFLEQALDDRSPEIRQKAGELLAQLPTSALSQRMRARAGQLLSYQEERFHVRFPAAIDAFWKHDGLEGEAPGDLKDSKNWLIQILKYVPLHFWEERFALKPKELIAALNTHEEQWSIITGWCQAARHVACPGWYLPLWRWLHEKNNVNERAILLALLTQADQQESESLIAYNIEQGAYWDDLLSALRKPWSLAFSTFFLQKLNEHLQDKQRTDYYQDVWYNTLLEAARAIAPESFTLALEICQVIATESPAAYAWNRQIRQSRNILHTRQQIREGIKG